MKKCRDDHCSKSKETRVGDEGWIWDQSLFCISSLHMLVASDYSAVIGIII